jgi:ubiquinone/menaquinone biosynthesis C-methylase UbiE
MAALDRKEQRVGDWDEIYKKHGTWLELPHEDMPGVADLFHEIGVKRVLDLGCGAGRHIVYLAQRGFEVYGLDSSDEALDMAREALAKVGLRAQLTTASMFDKLPYPDGFFDAIVCTKALNHGTIESIRKTILEMERVLDLGGMLFLVVTKTRKILKSKKQEKEAEIIADRTLVPKTGREIGVVHYQFNKAITLKEFRRFKVIDFHVDSGRNYCLTGRLVDNTA